MSQLNRRSFLKESLFAAGATFAIGGTKSSGQILGANEAIRIGVAGLNGRGGSHVDGFSNLKGVRITYLIDPHSGTFAARQKTIADRGGAEPKLVADVRHALDDKNLDAISIATPNHWHALMTIWACQAGKDVYVEKPCSHNVHEGRVAVEAARKYGRIVQHGTQSRSSASLAQVMELIKSGQLGKLLVARGLCYKRRDSIGFKEASSAPKELDFNLWLGPAPEQPFYANMIPYNWHWFWETGNGDIGNQGVHEMDIARWSIPGATLPKSVISFGGRFGYEDQAQTANTQISIMDFGDTQLIFEVRGRPCDAYPALRYTKKVTTPEGKVEEQLVQQGVGNVFHLEGGTIAGGAGGVRFYPKGSAQEAPLPKIDVQAKRGPGGGDHFANFIEAVRSRKQSDLNADILEGHYSSALCHLSNVSYRLGEQVPFNPRTKAFGDNTEAYETLERTELHLANDVKMQLDGSKYQLGRKLQLETGSETIMGDSAANLMLFREYRSPFVVPEKIA